MTKRVRIRSLFIGGCLTLFFIALLVRVYWIQVVEASWLLDKAQQSWETSEVLQPKRGTILDRNGNILAENAPAYTVAVNPKLIHDYDTAHEIAQELSSFLDMKTGQSFNKLYGLLTKKKEDGTYYTNVEVRNEGWKIDADIAKDIRAWIEDEGIKGVYLLEEQKRYYPSGELAAHLIGYTNKEGKAIMGLERQYDPLLHGKPGKIHYEKDLLGYELPDAKVVYEPAEDGKTIRLTIDQNIQHYMEQAMKKSYEAFKPKSMTAVAVDPQTMEILAFANLPSFNPGEYWDFGSHADFYNHAVGSIYEPGSTFKIITLAAAVDEGIFKPEEKYQSGSIRVPGGVIHDHNRSGWGEITYLEGLKRSSNVAFVKLGYEGLGGDKLREYIESFGFGQPTGVDLPGEASGNISFKYDTEIATATFGQGKVTVTAIQQAAAVAAIANGGRLMQPNVVKEIIDPSSGEVLERTEPKEIRQVISEQAASQVGEYLEQVVSDREIGTGRGAYIEGYRIAGKTGTANKVVGGKYAEDKWVVSFAGYAPVDDPKIVMIIIVDEPDLGGDYRRGGDVATPIFRETMAQSLRYLGVAKERQALFSKSDMKESKTIPDLMDLSIGAALNEASIRGFSYEVLGDGKKVVAQYPAPRSQTNGTSRIYIVSEPIEQLEMPDLTGQSLRDALEMCSILQVSCQFTGEGYVINQQWVNDQDNRVLQLALAPPGEQMRSHREEDALETED